VRGKIHHVNWVVFVEWIIKDQFQSLRINLFEVGQTGAEKGDVEEKDVELEDNAMPSPSEVAYQVPVHKVFHKVQRGKKSRVLRRGKKLKMAKDALSFRGGVF
jgi:hypothetical protein